jgi:hypothetical protein
MRDDLAIRRVIRCLDADNIVAQRFVVIMDVLDEFKLCISWSEQKPLFRRFESFDDLVVKVLILGRPLAGHAALLVVQVMVRRARCDIHFIDRIAIEKEDARFPVIEPDNGMVVLHMKKSQFSKDNQYRCAPSALPTGEVLR